MAAMAFGLHALLGAVDQAGFTQAVAGVERDPAPGEQEAWTGCEVSGVPKKLPLFWKVKKG